MHAHPHLMSGNAAIMAWYDEGVLDNDDAMAIAKVLAEPHKVFDIEVLQKNFISTRRCGILL